MAITHDVQELLDALDERVKVLEVHNGLREPDPEPTPVEEMPTDPAVLQEMVKQLLAERESPQSNTQLAPLTKETFPS